MVGVAIVAMVLAFGVPGFGTYLQNSKIRNAAESMQNGLALARTEAARRNTYVQFALVGTDSSWTVGCTTAAANCPATIQARTAAEGSNTVSVASSGFATALGFNGFGKVTTLSAGSTKAVFDISNPAGGTCEKLGGTMRCLRVEVSSGGQIRMCDPNLPTSNPKPQAC